MIINEIREDAQEKMKKVLNSLQVNLSKIRTGRAHTSLLEDIKVDYYGNETPLSQVASITVTDARTLSVTPWEKSMIKAVEKAILESDLGLNPVAVGNLLRIPMPALTEERRKELIKVVKSDVENAKISVRNVRRDANNTLKKLLKEKGIAEDDERKGQDQIQKLTDGHVKQIDEFGAAKEQDLLEI